MKKIIVLIIAILTINVANAQWQQCNGPYGGTIQAIIVKGSNIFVGTNGGGIYKSTDNGMNWIAVDSGLTNLGGYSFTQNDSVLFLGSGNGVFTTNNNGANWTGINNGLLFDSWDNPIISIAINGTNIFAGSDYGLFKSDNNGTSWSSILGTSVIGVPSLTISGTNIFAGPAGGGIYRSIDNGISWDSLKGLPNSIITYAFAVVDSNVFAGTSKGVYKFNSNDSSWSIFGLANYSIISLAVNGNNIYAGTYNGVYKNDSINNNWTVIGLTNEKIISLAVNGSNIFAGTINNGLFLSTNNGISWSSANKGIINTTILPIATKGTDVYVASYYGGLFKSMNNGLDWTPIDINYYGTDVSAISIINTNIYISIYGNGIYRSTDNGLSWGTINNGLTNIKVNSISGNESTIFAGTDGGGVFRTTDNGMNWNAVNNGLITTNTFYSSLTIIDTNIFVADYNSGNIFISSNNGTSWQQIANFGIPNTLAAFGKDLIVGVTPGIYQISFNGTNWTSIYKSSNIIPYRFAISGSNIFTIDNGSGVYLSTDNGTSWNSISYGLNDTNTWSLAVNDEYLFAGTNYAGVWRRPLSEIVGIKEQQYSKTEAIRVYPNPAKDNLTIETNSNTDQKIEILNLFGQTIYKTYIYRKSIINTSAFAKGIYILKLSSDKETVVKKFVKE